MPGPAVRHRGRPADRDGESRRLDNSTRIPASLAVESEVVSGDPVEALAAVSGELDLLVCGSRGHGPVGEVVLGSVSHALLGAVRCPLLVVPRAGDQGRDDQSRCFAA
ncbi:MAG TPA: universal stress protein [Solirubrobacteraceae bacterium]|nr:universal stress protein [Solirubrobacteraceae bacterium]